MKELISCYYIGKPKQLPKIKGTFTIWQGRNKELYSHLTAVTLNTQLNFIMKNRMSADEVRQMEIDSNAIFNASSDQTDEHIFTPPVRNNINS